MNLDQERMLIGFLLLLAVGIAVVSVFLRAHIFTQVMNMSADRMRMTYGFVIVVILALLAVVIALGKVEERDSFGLLPIITALATLAGAFAQWAFGPPKDGGPPPPAPPSDGQGKSN